MEFSEDEIKILVTLLEQLNYKLESAAIVLPILKKLKGGITQPDLNPSDNVEITTADAVSTEPEIIPPV